MLTSGGNGPHATVVVRRVDGAARDEIARGVMPDGSRDGRALVFVGLKPGNYTDLWHMVGDAAQLLLGTPYAEDEPALSPNATLLAYVSNETGQPDVFLQAYPEAGAKTQVCHRGGGRYPRWSPTGDRIYYRLEHREDFLPERTAQSNRTALHGPVLDREHDEAHRDHEPDVHGPAREGARDRADKVTQAVLPCGGSRDQPERDAHHRLESRGDDHGPITRCSAPVAVPTTATTPRRT